MTRVKPLRLWPGVVIVVLQWLLAFGVPFVAPDAEVGSLPVGVLAVAGGALGGLAVVIWWLLFSRAAWSERVGAILRDRRRDVGDQTGRAPVDREGRDGDAV